MSNFLYFCHRSVIWFLKSLVFLLLACTWCVGFRIWHVGFDLTLITDNLFEELRIISLLYGCITIFFWILWILFIFRLPPPPYSFSKERLFTVPVSPEGRFICSKENRKTGGYYSPSKKCYLFRKGEKLPDHLKLIRVPENVVLQFERNQFRELKANMKIDLSNHGYNALIDCEVWTKRINYINMNCVCGRPALIVSTNYPGDLDILENHCIDNFEDLFYGTALYNQDP